MGNIPYSITPNGITFVHKGSPRIVNKQNANFEALKTAVLAGDEETVEKLADIRKFIAQVTNGDVSITNDEVYFRNVKVPEYLAHRILEHVKNKDPIDSLCRFVEKLFENPDNRIIDQLFNWLEIGSMPLFSDGDILAYKMIRSDYFSHAIDNRTGTRMFQGIGEVVSMNRVDCDSNPNQVCSTGLHFCSYEYLPKYGNMVYDDGNRVIIVKINPKNVVSIPVDYNFTKGRCCEFEVVGEVPFDELATKFNLTRVVSSFGTYNSDEEDDLEDDYEEEETREFDFIASNGVGFYKEEIIDAVESEGFTRAALSLGVPRSTLHGWYKKI